MGKTSSSDQELLNEWLIQQRETAFHALVARYAGLVHATARRTCGDDSMAGEASQLTFITLARKARSLTTCTTLGGWLHTTALMQSKNLVRRSQRENRKRKLLQASMETGSSQEPDSVWQDIQPLLDDALSSLSEKDREALLLRFYRSLTVREVASTLGIATEAAQKRIDRATGRLRGKLARRGCVEGGSLGAAMLAGFATDSQAAAPLVSGLANKALVTATVGSTSTVGIVTLITTAAMKTTSYLPPLLSLIIAGVVIGNQRKALAEVEHQSERMRDRLAMNIEKVARSEKRISSVKDKSPINWKELVTRLNDPAVSQQFNKRLANMSVDELTESIREVEMLDFSREDRMTLDYKLVPRLIEIDPEALLTRFADHIGKQLSSGWRFQTAFDDWLKKDQDRAIAWLDGQISAGRFKSLRLDGSGGTRDYFETYAIGALLRSDPVAARTRLRSLNPDDQEGVIGSIEANLEKIDPMTFAQLVRDEFSESLCHRALSRQAGLLVEGTDYTRVSEYLNQIEATPTEKGAIIDGVVSQGVFRMAHNGRSFTLEDLDKIRRWVSTEAPDQLGAATGLTLGQMSMWPHHRMDFPEVVGLLNQYHESGGGDPLLFHFLDNTYPKDETNRSICRELARRITDEKQREQALERFK